MASSSSILVSACLLGINCRYDATNNCQQKVIDYIETNDLIPIPICPEQLGGLPTPRPKAWFLIGDGEDALNDKASMIDDAGQNPEELFRNGAQQALEIARLSRCKTAILKQRSPSCGSRQVYRQGELVTGIGITCALLRKNGLQVLSEEELA